MLGFPNEHRGSRFRPEPRIELLGEGDKERAGLSRAALRSGGSRLTRRPAPGMTLPPKLNEQPSQLTNDAPEIKEWRRSCFVCRSEWVEFGPRSERCIFCGFFPRDD